MHTVKVLVITITAILVAFIAILMVSDVNGATLNKIGILLEIVGGILAAPDIIVFIVGNEKMLSYDKSLESYVDKVSDALSNRDSVYRDALVKILFPPFSVSSKNCLGNSLCAVLTEKIASFSWETYGLDLHY